MQPRFFLVLTVLVGLPAISRADQGDPVAVRIWPHGVVSVETHWDLTVVVKTRMSSPLPQALAGADLVIACSPEARTAQVTWLSEHAVAATAKTMQVRFDALDHYLDRLPNVPEQTFLASAEATCTSKNAVRVSSVAEQLLMISVDGVRIAAPLSERFTRLEPVVEFAAVVLASPADRSLEQRAAALQRAQELHSRYVLLDSPLPGVQSEATAGIGNTFALRFQESAEASRPDASQGEDPESATGETLPTKLIQLSSTPWSMPEELLQLFVRKEHACSESQETFTKLSVAQMNFKPANGSHTPRWNAEHMMGRELGFFSQIYAEKTSEISPMDLNPKQMPPDYVARHADWDGREEARQMQRVSAFTRRFAYLLDDLDLDQKAPGSSWTPRKLLKQMDAHYQEHTANVIKKFELPEWPKE